MADELNPEVAAAAQNPESPCTDAECAETDVGAAARKIKEGAVELQSAVMDQGAEKFESLCKAADETIRANPYRSALAAFGVGAVVGLILFRR